MPLNYRQDVNVPLLNIVACITVVGYVLCYAYLLAIHFTLKLHLKMSYTHFIFRNFCNFFYLFHISLDFPFVFQTEVLSVYLYIIWLLLIICIFAVFKLRRKMRFCIGKWVKKWPYNFFTVSYQQYKNESFYTMSEMYLWLCLIVI